MIKSNCIGVCHTAATVCSLSEGRVITMVTYGDLFSFVIVITNIISLVLTFVIFIDNRRKK